MDMKKSGNKGSEEHPCIQAAQSAKLELLIPPTPDFTCANAARACAMLKAMANEDRLQLLCRLIGARLNVGELERVTGIRQPTLSQQLGVLRQEGLVAAEKDGRYVYYRLADDNVVRLMRTIWNIYCVRGHACSNS
ncbi:MAG: metalloregulator ArsR/SmtB family transcription factor [Betaproteobacteria bacterium]|nr:metalloregulator ArsR/SmtB family transcription factor [Betaproteobacteria bacterium]MCL2885905.1 metalloregulator ArsR/SmtB family transcription factor [Betaproteobacteria bacterium]